jgi:hypothetical protein
MSVKRAETWERTGNQSSLTLKILSPCVISTALFSMERSAIPFDPRFTSVVAVCSVTFVLIWIVEWVVEHWHRLATHFKGSASDGLEYDEETLVSSASTGLDEAPEDMVATELGRAQTFQTFQTLVEAGSDTIEEVA